MNLSPSHLIDAFGLIGIAAVIFAETGLLIGFFLPGDSLLFTAGAAAAGALPRLSFNPNIWVLILVVVVAAVAGDQTGYLLGRRAGPAELPLLLVHAASAGPSRPGVLRQTPFGRCIEPQNRL